MVIEARDRQGKKVYRISNLIDREGKEEQDFWARKSYQQLLKDPDKIIKEYLRGERREDKRREKIIKLMCGLEAANTPQEAGFACLKGLHDDLFDLHGQRAKGPFLSTMDVKNAELMAPHAKKENDSSKGKENGLNLDNQSISQEQSVDVSQEVSPVNMDTQRPASGPAQPQQSAATSKAEHSLEQQQSLADKLPQREKSRKIEIIDDLPEIEDWEFDIPGSNQDITSREDEGSIDFDAGKAFEESEKKSRPSLYADPVEFDVDTGRCETKQEQNPRKQEKGNSGDTMRQSRLAFGRQDRGHSSRFRKVESRDDIEIG